MSKYVCYLYVRSSRFAVDLPWENYLRKCYICYNGFTHSLRAQIIKLTFKYGKENGFDECVWIAIYFFSCVHEYMDIYSEIRSENTTKLIETPFGGRFCGPIPPRRRVSLYQGIALSFYTDKNVTFPSVFSGIYKFINACKSYPKAIYNYINLSV